ncbi:MAG: CBS domain-containing protein [Betaproteobacteria bacterium]|nr:CBS domain-containing protein [Betaproteobacteria bacterium]
MFSIYGIGGPIFSGTLEEMNRVRAVSRARPVRPVVPADEESDIEAVANTANRPNAEAVRAYRAMLPPEIERGPLYLADQIMQRRVFSVSAGDDVAHAWRVLRDHRIHQAPVLDDGARLVGIVSERDLLTAITIDAGRIVASLRRQVRDVMASPVIAATPMTDIRRIAAAMLDHGVDGVPVTGEGGRLMGFVSRSDILRAVVVDPPLSLWR